MLDAIDWEILIWLVVAALSGLGEALTGTLFLVPFAIAGVAAAIAVALGAESMWVLFVFGVVVLAALAWVIKFAGRTKDDPPATHEGAHRYVDARGSVTGEIDPIAGGRVKIGGESWRALSHTGESIEEGVPVRVIEVRGNALVVERV
jgi:membrane protein implicated in regulation of membrane protease activity